MGSSLKVWFLTLPDQHLTRPCLADCVLAIATGSVIKGVNSSVHVQCVVVFKTYSVELLSSETLVCMFVSSHLWWLIDYFSSWGTTWMDTCIYWDMGLFTFLQPIVKNFHLSHSLISCTMSNQWCLTCFHLFLSCCSTLVLKKLVWAVKV